MSIIIFRTQASPHKQLWLTQGAGKGQSAGFGQRQQHHQRAEQARHPGAHPDRIDVHQRHEVHTEVI